MNAQLQRLEVETAGIGDHDFAVEDASRRQLRAVSDRAAPGSIGSMTFRRGSG